MKTKAISITLFILLFCFSVSAQSEAGKDYLFSYQGKKKEHTLGLYGSISGSYTTLMGESANWFGGRVGVVLDNHWGLGLAGKALNYDHQLTTLATDGTYRLEGGYSGMFLEYLVPLKNWGKISVSWTTGMGILYYQYDKEYRKELVWTDEYIEVERFAANEFNAEVMFHLAGNWWVGVQGAYLNTSPVRLLGANEDLLRKFNAGVAVRYGIF